MKLRYLNPMNLLVFIIALFSFNTYSKTELPSINSSLLEDQKNSETDFIISILESEELSKEDKDKLIERLLEVDYENIYLLENMNIDTEEYRIVAGSHSFDF